MGRRRCWRREFFGATSLGESSHCFRSAPAGEGEPGPGGSSCGLRSSPCSLVIASIGSACFGSDSGSCAPHRGRRGPGPPARQCLHWLCRFWFRRFDPARHGRRYHPFPRLWHGRSGAGHSGYGDTKYSVAGFTKMFTAAAILTLEAEGRLRVTDSLARFFAGLPGTDGQVTLTSC